MTTRILLNSVPQLSSAVLGEVELPGAGLSPETARPGSNHFSAPVLAMAVLAVAVVAFLTFDFFRQKRAEKRERRRLERFREKQLNNASSRAHLNPPRDKAPNLPR